MSEKKIIKKQTPSKKKPLRIYNRFHWTQRIEHALLSNLLYSSWD